MFDEQGAQGLRLTAPLQNIIDYAEKLIVVFIEKIEAGLFSIVRVGIDRYFIQECIVVLKHTKKHSLLN